MSCGPCGPSCTVAVSLLAGSYIAGCIAHILLMYTKLFKSWHDGQQGSDARETSCGRLSCVLELTNVACRPLYSVTYVYADYAQDRLA